ncbi:hypothetical protein [Paraburkholderia sediminicola]|uniref:hypothetical protein n=1 Tax=Paraburkholderia sediminicola TaxID=458836 RepID=UPI0038B7CA28
MANADSMRQPGPERQSFEKTLVEQRSGDAGLARLHQALHYWFRRDTWTPDEAFPLLIGIAPDSLARGDSHVRYLDGSLVCIAASMHAHGVASPLESFDDLDALQNLKAVQTILAEMNHVWDSGSHPPRNPPGYFIEWARRKGFKVPWLESARELGFIKIVEDLTSATPTRAPDLSATDAPPAVGGQAVSLNIGSNPKIALKAYIARRARVIFSANETVAAHTREGIAEVIAAEMRTNGYRGTLGEYLSAATIVRAIPAGLTGGRARNGRNTR